MIFLKVIAGQSLRPLSFVLLSGMVKMLKMASF